MSSARFVLYVVLGVLAYCAGWLVYPLGVHLWGFLLETIAWPESRWGEQGSRLIGQALQPVAYFLIAGVLSVVLVLSSHRFAVRYSVLVSLGALSYFSVLLWLAQAPVSAAGTLIFEGFFCIVLLPVLTAVLVRLGWLTRRADGGRPRTGGPHAV